MDTGWDATDLLRGLAPQVLATLVRRHGDFDTCEDALQDALLAATTQWPRQGLPVNPRAWLTTVASRRLMDQFRSEAARRRRELATAAMAPADQLWAPGPDAERPGEQDDTLTLLFLCCHPSLSAPAAAALTLRAVGGLSTEEIARAYLTSESAMAQRIHRAKQRIKATGVRFEQPAEADLPERLRVVLHVLYLIFNEGHTATSGPKLQRDDLTGEALRLTREVHRLRRDDGEVAGLLALMLLTDARRQARTGPDGALIPLDEQDRSRWDRTAIEEGVSVLSDALATGPAGPYQLQAAIAAVHAQAPRAEDTDWRQILALYDLLQRSSPSPMVALNRAVAVAMVHGPRAALGLLGSLAAEERLAGHHRLEATRAHLLEIAGDYPAARLSYRRAARRAANPQERRYLDDRAARLVPDRE